MLQGHCTPPVAMECRLLDRGPLGFFKYIGMMTTKALELTISPSRTTFSPRMSKRPCECTAKAFPWYIRSEVSSRMRFAVGDKG
jgi:hypothetical protein